MRRTHFIILLILVFSITRIFGQENEYPKRITVTAEIDSVIISPCHYMTLYLLFKIKKGLNTGKDSLFLSQGLRGYNHSFSYLKKLYPDITPKDINKRDKTAEVLLGLYYDSESSEPITEWISETWRENSFIQLRAFLIQEGVYKKSPYGFPVRSPKTDSFYSYPCGTDYFYPSLIYEQTGHFFYTKNGKNMIAIENPLGSGKWSCFEQQEIKE